MNNRLFIPTLALFLLISLKLNAQPGIILDSIAPAPTGQTVCIPVKAKGFFCVISMQGSISWNPQVLDYDKTQNYILPGMGPFSFNYNAQGERLLFSWWDANAIGITKDDGEVLFEICFIIIGPAGSSSYIKIDSAEILSCNSENLWTYAGDPYMNYYFTVTTDVSELTTSKQPTITINPNPTSSGAEAIFDSKQDGTATLFVTNPLGQIVFEEKISISIGENKIEVPAGVLKTTGIYQVSLQTEQTVTSHLLFVN